jgi:pimeloyl-ACP methyl ester carboxylesterase
VRLTCSRWGPASGRPLVLLHAWGESRRCFDRLVPLLPAGTTVVALDLRGHGDSDRPADGYSLARQAADVVAVLDALEAPSGVLLGSSSGGYLAQQVAVTRPDRVAGLVLAGSPRSLVGRPPFADEVEALTDPVDPGWVRRSLAWFPRYRPVPEWYVEDRVQDGARIPAHVWREAFRGLLDAVPPTEAGTVRAPALVVGGGRDELLTRPEEEALAAAVPGSRLVLYEDTGHLVLWEQPERLAADVGDFLRRCP